MVLVLVLFAGAEDEAAEALAAPVPRSEVQANLAQCCRVW